MPIFGGIREDILELLLDTTSIVTVAKGDYFFHEGDRPTCLYVLETGVVVVLKTWQSHDYVLKHLKKGDCFGEMSMMDLLPRSASVLAREDCTAIEISSEHLQQIYEKDLEQFLMIQMNMGREISRRLREADRRLFAAKVEAEIVDGDIIFHHT